MELRGPICNLTAERGVRPGKFEIFLEASRAFATAGARKLNFPDLAPVLGVNHLAAYGRWAFTEFTEIYQMEADFKAKVENEFKKMIEKATKP